MDHKSAAERAWIRVLRQHRIATGNNLCGLAQAVRPIGGTALGVGYGDDLDFSGKFAKDD